MAFVLVLVPPCIWHCKPGFEFRSVQLLVCSRVSGTHVGSSIWKFAISLGVFPWCLYLSQRFCAKTILSQKQKNMELSSPENGFDELNDLLKENDPCLSDELDRSYIVNKEENAADYPFGNLTSSNDFCADDNEHMQQNPLSLPKDFSYYDFCRSHQHIFDNDVDLSEPKFAGDEERLISSPQEYCQQGEAEDLCSDYLSRSSFQVELETLHNKTEAEVCEHILESFTKKDRTEEQEMEDRQLASPSQKGMLPESLFSMSTYESTKTELANREVKEEYLDIPTEQLHISVASPVGNDESESEQVHFVKKSSTVRSPETSPDDVGSTEMLHSDQLASNRSPRVSKSPDGIRQTSFTHDMCPCTYLSPGSPKTSSPQSIQESPYSSKSDEQKNHISPEDSDHFTQYEKKKPASSMGSRKGARDMDDLPKEHLPASPKYHHSHQVRRRRNRSVSRSPVRQKESSSRHRREHRERTRSRSLSRRYHHRRSPRRRHSPRCRSPPSSYRSHRRSPRRRHWSPPHNRSTGLGKPGRNLFVAGFSFLTTEKDLERKFSRFGRVRDVRIVRNKRSGDSRGFGFLTLERDEEADAAIRALDKTEWNGRIVLVEKSKPH